MTHDRTRAIVEAAEELATALRLTLLRDADGRPFAIQHYDFADAKVRSPAGAALRMLADALSLPAPQWTRTPPSEPGCYLTFCRKDAAPMPFLSWLTEGGSWVVAETESVGMEDVANWQWWPVRIEEPPA